VGAAEDDDVDVLARERLEVTARRELGTSPSVQPSSASGTRSGAAWPKTSQRVDIVDTARA